MNNYYFIEKNVNKLHNGKYTNFLDQKQAYDIKSKLKNIKYKEYYPYIDSEKVIFYNDKIPKITLFKINTDQILKHQEILGTLLSLGIEKEMIGDIIITNNNYYFYVMDEIKEYILLNFIKIKNINITLTSINIDTLKNYKREYEENTLIVSSERIDNVIASITKINRNKIKDKIKNKEIILNYEILNNPSKLLKKNDIFSIKKYGKFKYYGIIGNTKKERFIIKYFKYK